MKRLSMVMMMVLWLSSVVFGVPLLSDDFSSIDTAKWYVDLAFGAAGPTGSVTAVADGSWNYAQVYDGTNNAGDIGWKGSTLATQAAFTIGQGLNIKVTMMFPSYEPGFSDGLTYRPNMTLQDASGTAHVAVYSPFASGSTSAPIKMQTLNAGVLADTHSTPEVGTSGWYLFDMDVYTDHANIKVLENGVTLRDQWSVAYDAMDSVKVGFSANAPYPGWGPDAKLLVDEIQINPITNPFEMVAFQNGLNGYYEQTDAMMQAGALGSSGYWEPELSGVMYFSQVDGTRQGRNLLKFDLEGLLPEGAVVETATLSLTVKTPPSPVPPNPVGLAAYQAYKPWNPKQTIWTNWGWGGYDAGYCNPNPDGTTYFAPDVSANYQCSMPLNTSMVQGWIDRPWENYGVLLHQLDWQEYSFYVFGTEVIGTDQMQYGPKLVISYSYPAGAKSLTRGHRTLLKKGLQILANYVDGYSFSMSRFQESKCTTLDTPDDYLHWDWIQDNPDVLWARMTWNPILPGELPFLKNCVSFKEGDEQDILASENLQHIKSQFNTFRTGCPNAILFTNQYGGQYTYNQIHDYVLYTQPDMVMFDWYPFSPNQVGLPTNYYSYMATYRQLGLEGLDGTGNMPIPSALYTQTFVCSDPRWQNHRVTESEMRLNQFAAWAFGFKYIDLFVYMTPERAPEFQSLLFNGMGDTSPTAEFYQMAETNRQSRNLGPALVRLLSTDLRMIPGRNASGVVNPTPSGVTAGLTGADPYLTGITVTNIGTKNNNQPGDVLVGFFKPLHESFDGSNYTNEKYFMITNGLSDATGTAAETRQRISVDFNFGTSGINSLQRLSRLTGHVETVSLTAMGGSVYRLTLDLDGGTGDLFKFNTGAPFIGATISPVLTVTPESQSVAAGSGSTSFGVANTGTGEMAWTAAVQPGSEWLTITSGTSGSNAGTINVEFTANTGAQRTGTIRITASGATGSPVDVTVVQAAAPVLMVLAVTPASQDVAWVAGTTTFEVANTGGGEMAWSAEVVSGGEWLHLASGSGTNAGTISVDVDQNDDTVAARTGTLRITAAGATGSPVDVTVVQAKHPGPGDANEDGVVNFSDYLKFSVGFGSTGTPGTLWGQGDFNEDGVVNFSDYLVLSSNFGSGGAVSADEVAKFQAASASFEDASQAEAVQQTLPCTPLAMALMAVIGLALYGLGSSFRNERQ